MGAVVDFGAGDGRFAAKGAFDSYLGYEVDTTRTSPQLPAKNAQVVMACAFSHRTQEADVCVGNPPYVRNQDLPLGWRDMAAREVRERTGVNLSGLANAWQYFVMLGLWSVRPDGLIVQIIPFEWVSRPSAGSIRKYIDANGWGVDVYRLPDGIFERVLTAASITVIDKRGPSGWRLHHIAVSGDVKPLRSPAGGTAGVLRYARPVDSTAPRAKRGLSPGTQHVLTLTEGERVHAGLHIHRDVVECVTSLRMLPADLSVLDLASFRTHVVSRGLKCWLIRTDRAPSLRLKAYLDGIDPSDYQTATCLEREEWWRFRMPSEPPDILIAQAFKALSPKVVVNDVRAHAVGGVAGIYGVAPSRRRPLVAEIKHVNLQERLVPYANDMLKVEINQINAMLLDLMRRDG